MSFVSIISWIVGNFSTFYNLISEIIALFKTVPQDKHAEMVEKLKAQIQGLK